jgi:hypothetical protein
MHKCESGGTFILQGDEILDPPARAIYLLHPHALFTEGVSLFAMTHLISPGSTLLIDKHLYYLSPLGMVWIVMVGGCDVGPLVHSHVKTVLGRGRRVVLFPGGFMEATDFSRCHETLYIHMYTYWMRMAREHSYGVYSIFGYNLAGRYLQQSSWMLPLRLKLSRRCIPSILPSGIVMSTAETSPVYMYGRRIAPHEDTLASIRDGLLQTIEAHEKIHGRSVLYNVRTEI